MRGRKHLSVITVAKNLSPWNIISKGTSKLFMKGRNHFHVLCAHRPSPWNIISKQHIETVHEGGKSFECDHCSKNFPRKDLLKSHIATVHKMKKDTASVSPTNDEYNLVTVQKEKNHKNLKILKITLKTTMGRRNLNVMCVRNFFHEQHSRGT